MLDVINYYEQLVIDQLWQVLEAEEEPLTRAYLEDVACLALNSLPTCYVRHMADKSASLSEQEHHDMQEQVRLAIEQAIEQARQRPHHNRE